MILYHYENLILNKHSNDLKLHNVLKCENNNNNTSLNIILFYDAFDIYDLLEK